MIAIIIFILLVMLIVWMFSKGSGITIKCDYCGYKFMIKSKDYDIWAKQGKKCFKCKKCVNK